MNSDDFMRVQKDKTFYSGTYTVVCVILVVLCLISVLMVKVLKTKEPEKLAVVEDTEFTEVEVVSNEYKIDEEVLTEYLNEIGITKYYLSYEDECLIAIVDGADNIYYKVDKVSDDRYNILTVNSYTREVMSTISKP